MSRYVLINRHERWDFLDGIDCFRHFSDSIRSRYQKQNIRIPRKLKCALWCADTVVYLANQYSHIITDSYNKYVHVSDYD